MAGFFVHGALAWTYLIAIGLSLLSSNEFSDEDREQEC